MQQPINLYFNVQRCFSLAQVGPIAVFVPMQMDRTEFQKHDSLILDKLVTRAYFFAALSFNERLFLHSCKF